jgi:hypothetical protein
MWNLHISVAHLSGITNPSETCADSVDNFPRISLAYGPPKKCAETLKTFIKSVYRFIKKTVIVSGNGTELGRMFLFCWAVSLAVKRLGNKCFTWFILAILEFWNHRKCLHLVLFSCACSIFGYNEQYLVG